MAQVEFSVIDKLRFLSINSETATELFLDQDNILLAEVGEFFI